MRLKIKYSSLFLFLLCLKVNAQQVEATTRPNVILIMTDDQGFGDLGFYGNPHIKTPTIDRFAEQSVRFDQFMVSPVCAPTRASLMTGRYSLRTGVRDTYRGGAIMAAQEITLAEMLKEVGYTTGMVGKWHLGDNYPSRPQDQGFDFTLRHLSGGIGQPGDWPNTFKRDSSYFNPILWKNGQQFQSKGYCTDVFTNTAIDFIDENQDKPFFLYLAYNAPHAPLQVPQEYYNIYKNIDPSEGFENDGRPFPEMTEKNKEQARKVYAMVTNIDDNLNRLFKKLDDLYLKENTLVIFMTDNGHQHDRYAAGMRGRKSFVYEGGVRVPSFWRLPSKFTGNRDISTPAAHYDVVPTLAALCGVRLPKDRKIDGKNLLPLLTEKESTMEIRPMARSWVRGGPEKYQNISFRMGQMKLVGNCEENSEIEHFELYNIETDPYEQQNIVNKNDQLAKNLKAEMDDWLKEMTTEPHYIKSHPAIIGTKNEPTTVLNLNDAEFEKNDFFKKDIAGWHVQVEKNEPYDIKIHTGRKLKSKLKLDLLIDNHQLTITLDSTSNSMINLENIPLKKGTHKIVPLLSNSNGYIKPFYMKLKPSSR